ncbi:MAG: rhodanese-like domain-containing protein [Candidatus Saccharibacteria bacterium]|nr:rhodanese-like domain-containing protein [Candidatus Saccharibacteria bacterium]
MQRMIIDVREPEEFIKGHVQGAINVPPSDIMQGAAALKDIPKDTEIILYCVSGSRSNVSKQILESQGFSNVINGINKDQVQSKYGS